jgi:hypothetical protein
MHKKIDVMIVGAQKAATTSLLRYLGEHPECISHPQKEFSYFTDTKEYNEGLQTAFRKYYAHDSISTNQKIVAKNASLFTNRQGLQRLKDHNPNCQIVIILRNPVERTYSSYLMERNYGAINFEFSELPELIKKYESANSSWDYNFFIDFSLYAHHLKSLFELFPAENVTVLLYEELKGDPLAVCSRIFSKAGVDPSFKPKIEVRHNVTKKTRSTAYAKVLGRFLHNQNPVKKAIKKFLPGHKVYKYGDLLRDFNKVDAQHEEINQDTKQFLIEFYKPHNRELEQMLGIDLSSWNK